MQMVPLYMESMVTRRTGSKERAYFSLGERDANMYGFLEKARAKHIVAAERVSRFSVECSSSGQLQKYIVQNISFIWF